MLRNYLVKVSKKCPLIVEEVVMNYWGSIIERFQEVFKKVLKKCRGCVISKRWQENGKGVFNKF